MPEKPKSSISSQGKRIASLKGFLSSRSAFIAAGLLFIVLLGTLIYFQSHTWLNGHKKSHDINFVKEQTSVLNSRMEQLEETIKKHEAKFISVEQFKHVEDRISSLFQQVESLQSQPKSEVPLQQLEQSQNIVNEVARLRETQKILKSLYLLRRLKIVILSNVPYRAELNDLKTVVTATQEIALLDRYADEGLQQLIETKQEPRLDKTGNSLDSWWNHIILMVKSFVKIEKIDASTNIPKALQSRHMVEDALEQIEKTMIQQLLSSSTPPSPQSGDA